MRISHLTINHTFNDHRILYKQAKKLSKGVNQVSIFAFEKNQKNFVEGGIHIHLISDSLSLSFLGRIRRLIKLLPILIKDKSDIYIVHEIDFLTIAIFFKVLNKKLIYDIHEDYATLYGARKKRESLVNYAAILFIDIFQKIAIRFLCNGIITASQKIHDKFKICGKQALYYPNLSSLDNLDKGRKNPNLHSTTNISYIGGITKYKGLEFMINLYDELMKQKFIFSIHFAGRMFFDDDCPIYQKFTTYEKTKTNFIYHGIINNHGLQDLLLNSNFGLCFLDNNESYNCSQPVKIYDYICTSTFILASSNLDLSYLDNSERFCKQFNTEDVNAVAKYIISYANKQEYKTFDEVTISNFHINSLNNNLELFLQDILKK